MLIPAVDLRAQHAPLRDELIGAFAKVLDGSAFIHGSEVEAFEEEFAAYCEARHAIGVANGTDALALPLRALGIGRGDAVAVPAFTFAATAEAVCHTGARPVFVDIDPHTFTLDPAALRRAARRQPLRAVIPVHLYGQPAAMDDIAAVARELAFEIVEDAAQAHGARYGSRRVGALGKVGGFSFYPTKNLGALGDAGAVTTNDAELAARVRLLCDHGQPSKYVHSAVGFNSRLDGVQAAMLRVKLRHLDHWNVRRRALADRYRAGLSGVTGVELPAAAAGREHVYHLFVIRCRARDALKVHLAAQGIGASVHYALPLHLQSAFAQWASAGGDCPAAEAAAREVLALPLYPELDDASVDAVCAAVRDWARLRR